MPYSRLPPSLGAFEVLIETFSAEARASARRRRGPRRKVGGTIRPGRDTPLWNKLIDQVQPLLQRRGERAQLARLLGVHRQAVTEYFASQRRMPDAERTLLLLEWLRVRRQGKRPAW
jgi:hypothetical protein